MLTRSQPTRGRGWEEAASLAQGWRCGGSWAGGRGNVREQSRAYQEPAQVVETWRLLKLWPRTMSYITPMVSAQHLDITPLPWSYVYLVKVGSNGWYITSNYFEQSWLCH